MTIHLMATAALQPSDWLTWGPGLASSLAGLAAVAVAVWAIQDTRRRWELDKAASAETVRLTTEAAADLALRDAVVRLHEPIKQMCEAMEGSRYGEISVANASLDRLQERLVPAIALANSSALMITKEHLDLHAGSDAAREVVPWIQWVYTEATAMVANMSDQFYRPGSESAGLAAYLVPEVFWRAHAASEIMLLACWGNPWRASKKAEGYLQSLNFADAYASARSARGAREGR